MNVGSRVLMVQREKYAEVVVVVAVVVVVVCSFGAAGLLVSDVRVSDYIFRVTGLVCASASLCLSIGFALERGCGSSG